MKLLRTTMWSVAVVVTVASFMAAIDNSMIEWARGRYLNHTAKPGEPTCLSRPETKGRT
jgi:hypothetical protein